TSLKKKHFTFDDIPDLTGKVAVVTGGNAGIEYITFIPEGGIEFEKLNDPNALDSMPRYDQSKLANILFTNELNKHYLEGEKIYANSLHPGIIRCFSPFCKESERTSYAEDDDLAKRRWRI
ncbi:1372_t:CDS:2, partial [Racocetra persica]